MAFALRVVGLPGKEGAAGTQDFLTKIKARTTKLTKLSCQTPAGA
jgi:hypothetical protein